MEADFNAAMKLLISHHMICKAIKAQAIPKECFGSHPEHTAIQVSLNQCMIVDVSQQWKSTLAITSVNCLTCYDSAGHPPAPIACQRLGIPPSILCTIFKSIQMMKFFLRTAHHNLDQFYGGPTAGLLFQGVCQGNSAGPTIWLAVSIVLINMVQKNGSSATLTSPITHRSTNLVGLLYIDDCNLLQLTLMALHQQTPSSTSKPISTCGKADWKSPVVLYPPQNLHGVY